ncbi:MAG: DUF5615 family PIN-like protein [Phycisphaerae bacterium]|nr:DUF5615 family PIN-like protein [Phycisphaerae bacterium]
MRLLIDTCVAVRVASALRAAGHDVVYVGDRAEDPGDEEILREAAESHRVLITRDKDFGALAVLHGRPHQGIVLLRRLPLGEQAAVCLSAIQKHSTDLQDGAIITVQPGRLRTRRPGQS